MRVLRSVGGGRPNCNVVRVGQRGDFQNRVGISRRSKRAGSGPFIRVGNGNRMQRLSSNPQDKARGDAPDERSHALALRKIAVLRCATCAKKWCTMLRGEEGYCKKITADLEGTKGVRGHKRGAQKGSGGTKGVRNLFSLPHSRPFAAVRAGALRYPT